MSRSFVVIAALALAIPALAAQSPKSGSFQTTSAWKAIGDATQIGGRTLGHGTLWGMIIGDNPLHIKTAVCPYINEQDGDTNSFNGRCAWSDADGDQVFTEWSVKLVASTGVCEGPQPITGGSGKFRGIQGRLPIQCQVVDGARGQFLVTHQWTYQVP